MSSEFLIFFHAYVVTFDYPGWKCVALKREKGNNEGGEDERMPAL